MAKLKQLTRQEVRTKIKEAFKKLAAPFALFSLASIMLSVSVPALVGVNGAQPNIFQLSAVGIAVIIPGALFIWWASRILKLSTAWMILVVFFLSVVAIIKFVLVPNSLYSQTYRIDQGGLLPGTNFDPNLVFSYLVVSVSVLLLYTLIFWIYYRVNRARIISLKLSQKQKVKHGRKITGLIVTLIAVILLMVISGGIFALVIVPLSLFGGTLQYLKVILDNGGLTLTVALLVATIFAFKSIQVSARDSIAMKRPTIIVICAWIALSVLLMYQIVWIIYMTVLLTLAPFKVIYFSSK